MTSVVSGQAFHGRRTVRIESPHLWLEALADGGPRIVRLGLAGDPANLFAELPEAGWDTPLGRYENIGGHRLWFAPETLTPGVPDATGLTVEPTADGVRLIGRLEETGLRRTIEVGFAADRAELRLAQAVANEGDAAFELAAWGITQMRLGGTAFIPQPVRRPAHAIVPNRKVVLWPYSSWDDPRVTIAEGLIAVDAQPRPAGKVGSLSHRGVVGYLRDGVLLVKRFEPAVDQPHADFGCNTELYFDEHTIEVETLGPLVRVGPGEAAHHDERWELRQVSVADAEARVESPAALIALAERLGLGPED